MPRRLLAYQTPNQISGLVCWLKADALVLTDGDPVASWTDSSGNGNTPVQATATNKPTYTATILNNKPVVRFDGNDGLVMPTPGNFDLATPTIFVVTRRNSGSGGAIMGKSTTGFTDGRRRKMSIVSPASYSSGSDSQSIGLAATATNWNMFGVVSRSDTDHSMFLNGAETITTSTLSESTYNTASMIIGSNFGVGTEAFTGDIAEIIIYNKPLANIEVIGLQNYLANKYALPVTPSLGGYPRGVVSGRILIRDYGNAVKTNYAVGSSVTWVQTPFNVPTVVTACLWLKLKRNTASIFDIPFGFGNTRWFFIFNSTSNKPGFNIKSGGVEKSSGFISSPMLLDQWYFLCGTYDPAAGANNLTIRVYDRNGQLYGAISSTQTGSLDSSGYPLTFGRDVVRAFNMDVEGDEMHVYSRILTTAEMDAMALGSEPSTSGLELWARCNETSGNLADSSGNSRTGTNNAGCTFVTSLGNGTRLMVGTGVAT
jgi:hypothetical protein